jgi:hypothetical protein
VTDLAAEIVAVVERRPAITTRQILTTIRRRRADILAILLQLERERILRSECGRYGARLWWLWDRFPGRPAHLPGASDAEPHISGLGRRLTPSRGPDEVGS